MYCPHCGTYNIQNARFCTHCGAQLTAGASIAHLSTRPHLLPGKSVLDKRYEIVSHVSSGGFGRVYRAEDHRFSAIVAIKEMTGDYQNEEEKAQLEKYFQQEAQVLFNLRHPSLPRVIDYFTELDRFFLVMEFVEGESLRKIIEQNPLPPFDEKRAKSWFFNLLDIMDYLHSRNPPIIHRDIKPDNLIWQEENQILYLVDFGIIRVGCSTRTLSFGTPGYASPEQASGKAHPAVDIYSAGATLHHLLSGIDPMEHPFDFESLLVLRPDMSPCLARTIDRMVALRIRDRFQSVQEIREYFEIEGKKEVQNLKGGTKAAALPPAAPPMVTPLLALPSQVNMSHPPAKDNKTHPAAQSKGSSAPPAGSSSPLPVVASPAPVAQLPDVTVSPRSSPVITRGNERQKVEISLPRRPSRPVGPGSPATVPGYLHYAGNNSCGYEEYENEKDGALLIWIPPGEFSMGAVSEDREGKSDEKPLHTVFVSGFWIYKYPVANRQYANFAGIGGVSSDWEEFWEKSGDQYPVVMVTWDDAAAYCKWAGGSFPSEAQWEKAARGNDERIFPWGSFYDNSRFNCWDSPRTGMRAHFFEEKGPTPAGCYGGGESSCGCFDMSGNVWEWALDVYDEHYYKSPVSSDPVNLREKGDSFRVLRGGSWNALPRDCRVSRRLKSHRSNGTKDRGFRCVVNEEK